MSAWCDVFWAVPWPQAPWPWDAARTTCHDQPWSDKKGSRDGQHSVCTTQKALVKQGTVRMDPPGEVRRRPKFPLATCASCVKGSSFWYITDTHCMWVKGRSKGEFTLEVGEVAEIWEGVALDVSPFSLWLWLWEVFRIIENCSETFLVKSI